MATRTISTKVAITGESEYRASITAINNELKTLDSALRLVDSTFQGQANSIEALSARQTALADIQQTQAKKVEELRAALDNARSSVQAHADAVAAARQKLEENRAALERLKTTEGDTTEEQKRLNEEIVRNEEAVKLEEAALSAAEKGVQSWERQLNNAQVQLNSTNREISDNEKYLAEAKASADGTASSIDEYGKKVKKAGEDTEDANRSIDKMSDGIEALAGVLAAAGVDAAFDKIRDALESCVSAFQDFQYAMSGVAAIANASTSELGALTAKAQEIGATTLFTASQAAEALQYMALAGWNAEEMLAGIDGVINLAAASGENLGTVSDIVTDALTAFGLSASDAGHFVDVLAQASANSNTTVTMLGEAFKYAAPVAGALGYSVEDVAVATGLMADNGIKGSMAGTAMRTMFTSLNGTIELTGRSFGTIQYSAQNADGTMKSFSETINDLRGYFSQMTDTERVSNAQAIAGQRAYAGLLAVLNATEQDYNSLTAAINDCTGAAERMRDVRMDNLQGDVFILQSAVDGLKTEIGSQLEPSLRTLTQAETDAVDWAHRFVDEHEGMVEVVTILVTVSGVFAVSLVGLSVAAGVVTKAMAALNAVMMANPWILAAAAVAALVTALAAVTIQAQNAESPIRDVQNAVKDMRSSFEEADDAFNTTAGEATAAAELAGAYLDRLSELEAQGSLTAEQQSEYNATLSMLQALLPDVNFELDETTGFLVDGAEAARALVDNWKEMAVMAAMQDQLKTKAEALVNAQLALNDAEKYQNDLTARQTQLENEKAEASRLLGEAERREGEYAAAGAWEAASAQNGYGNELMSINAHLAENAREQDAASDAVAEAQKAVEEAQTEVEDLAETYAKLTEEEKENTAAAEEAAAAQEKLAESIASIQESVDDLAKSFSDEYAAAYSALKGSAGLTGEFKAEIDEAIDSTDKLMERWEANAEAMARYAENLQKAQELGLNPRLLSDLADGSAESAAILNQIISDIEGGEVTVERVSEAYANLEQATIEAALQAALASGNIEGALEELAQVADDANFEDFLSYAREAFAAVGLDIDSLGIKWDELNAKTSEGIDLSPNSAVTAFNSIEEAAIAAADTIAGIDFAGRTAEAVGAVEESTGQAMEVTEAAVEAVTGSGEAMTEQAAQSAEAVGASAQSAADAASEAETAVSDSLAAAAQAVADARPGLVSSMTRLGSDMIGGMIVGIDNRAGALYAKIYSVVNNAILTAKAAAESNSPSKRTIRLFEDVDEGMIVGAENKKEDVAKAVQGVVNDALTLDIPDFDIPDVNQPVYLTATTARESDMADRVDSLSSELRDMRGVLSVIASAVTGPRSVELEDGTIVARYTKKINQALGMAGR